MDNLNLIDLHDMFSIQLQIEMFTNPFISNFMGILNMNILESQLNIK